MESFVEFWNRNRAAIIGCASGIVIGILFLTIGFFPTILLAVLGGAGAFIGAKPGFRSAVAGFFGRIFRKNDDD